MAASNEDTTDRMTAEFRQYSQSANGLDELLQESNKQNILSLDGGGIRGYWSLLVIEKLMQHIADIEQSEDYPDIHEEPHDHSFAPEPYPETVSQNLTPSEERERQKQRGDDRIRVLNKERRYLPCHYFDMICGSSTGALIAIMFGRFRMTVRDCLDEYENLGAKIFGKPRFFTPLRISALYAITNRPKFDASLAEDVFEDVSRRRCGLDEKLEPSINYPTSEGVCKIFVTTFLAKPQAEVGSDLSTYLIRSYNHEGHFQINSNPSSFKPGPGPSRVNTNLTGRTGQSHRTYRLLQSRKVNYGKADNFKIWEVARAATAAPFFFKQFEHPTNQRTGQNGWFIDGGFSHTNNPTMQALHEIQEPSGNGSVDLVVSIGTSRKTDNSGSGIKQMVKQMVSLSNDPEKVHEDVQGASEVDGVSRFEYYRFNHTDLEMEMDEWKPQARKWWKPLSSQVSGSETIEKMKASFNAWAAKIETYREVQSCAEKLVIHRRNRVKDEKRWEQFATGSQYRCRLQGCTAAPFTNKVDCRQHLIDEHEFLPNSRNLHDQVDAHRSMWRYQEGDNRD